MAKTPEQRYREREKRVTNAIRLKVPDKVPVIVHWGYFPARYSGIPCDAAYYDVGKWRDAYKKTFKYFEPDMGRIQPAFPGKILEALDYQPIKWPGHGLSSEHGHQYIEGEYMKSDEYDVFLRNLSDFLIRSYLPRMCGNLGILNTLPPLGIDLFNNIGVADLMSALATPECIGMLQAFMKAKKEISRYRSEMRTLVEELKDLGFPIYAPAISGAPFDTIADFFRGMRGAMLDIYRQPDKVLESCEKLLPMMIERGVLTADRFKNRNVFIPLHRGSDGFMSLEHFETFYWPTLKKLIVALVDKDLTPCVFFEGDWTARLEYLLELPKGKVLGHFDVTDVFRTKEILKDHMCIRGNVPSSLLCVGTTDDVKDYCKKLIEVVGKGGGFILSPGSSIDEAKPENVKAMIDTAKERGTYS
ncbi:MAG: hypothetical protein JRJ85_11065 [Deltaproteobacteria bacterium]|nr:hypothetical protein [Deltaproteobacteria bacterium]